MEKKKISFDVPIEDYKKIKEFCSDKKIKISEFYRNAGNKIYKYEKNFITIYIILNESIGKYKIPKDRYNIKLKLASEDMIENVGAVQEGTISLIDNNLPPLSTNENHLQMMMKLDKSLKINNGYLKFFTKEKF